MLTIHLAGAVTRLLSVMVWLGEGGWHGTPALWSFGGATTVKLSVRSHDKDDIRDILTGVNSVMVGVT